MDEWQSTGAIEAAFAEDGPIMAARRWLISVLGVADIDAAWSATDPDFRRVLAQRWAWARRHDDALAGLDAEQLAEALAIEFPEHELWPACSAALLDDLEELWSWVDLDGLGATSPELVAIGYELVGFAPVPPGSSVIRMRAPQGRDPALTLLMRHLEGRWVVSGLGGADLPQPGWPPSGLERPTG